VSLGIFHYKQALQQQLSVIESLKGRRQHSEILFFEAKPVITLGLRGSKNRDLLGVTDIEVLNVDRGGEATYHGPGQLMIFPIAHLPSLGYSVREWVALLLDVTVDFLKARTIPAQWKESCPGVFTKNGKIASIGLKIQNGWSRHGLALNIESDPQIFSQIRACGVQNAAIDQMANWLPVQDLGLSDLAGEWERIFRQRGR
jgi:lipoyl(octanoyl) transferase